MSNSDYTSQTIRAKASNANIEEIKTLAPRKTNWSFGYAVTSHDIQVRERREAILRDCTAITPEYELKWDAVQVGIEDFDFSATDLLADFARTHQLEMHGHTLCWHSSIPAQCRTLCSRDFTKAAEVYIRNVLTRYKEAIRSWQVVNEPLDERQPHGLRRSPFSDAYGADYIAQLFSLAGSIDPTARLILNEMGLEYGSSGAELKRNLMLDLLGNLLAAGTPIHCLGIQSHLNAADFVREDHRAFSKFLEEVSTAGIEIMITELDVDDRDIGGDEATKLNLVTETYREYVSLVAESSTLIGVNIWGLSDDHSWLNQNNLHPKAKPLALDADLQRKPAWQAVQEALHGVAAAGFKGNSSGRLSGNQR